MELFLFYKLSFVVAALSSGSLSIIGKHFLSRGSILEIFFLSQMAILGNLLSRLLFHNGETSLVNIGSSYLLFGLGKYLLHRIKISTFEKGNFMVGGYLFLVSLQYLIIGYFPQLDSHMSIGFFGNMVTASKIENISTIIIFCLFILIYFPNQKKIKKRTIEINILNTKDTSSSDLLLFTTPLISSLYGLGFLYTMSFLLLPSLIIGKAFASERMASIYIVFISALSSISGLFLSISFERLSTSPLQILILFLVLLVTKNFNSK